MTFYPKKNIYLIFDYYISTAIIITLTFKPTLVDSTIPIKKCDIFTSFPYITTNHFSALLSVKFMNFNSEQVYFPSKTPFSSLGNLSLIQYIRKIDVIFLNRSLTNIPFSIN